MCAKFPGALLGPAMGNGSRGFWSIPRAALMAYLRDKGKPAALPALRARP
jgi:hypothetical protein